MIHFRRNHYCYQPLSVDLFISNEEYKAEGYKTFVDSQDLVKCAIRDSLNLIFTRGISNFDSFQEAFQKVWWRRKPRIGILRAHGGLIDGEWVYFDREKPIPVQRWVDKHDKKSYSMLLICCCNPQRDERNLNFTLRSNRTPVLYPNDVISYEREYKVIKST